MPKKDLSPEEFARSVYERDARNMKKAFGETENFILECLGFLTRELLEKREAITAATLLAACQRHLDSLEGRPNRDHHPDWHAYTALAAYLRSSLR